MLPILFLKSDLIMRLDARVEKGVALPTASANQKPVAGLASLVEFNVCMAPPRVGQEHSVNTPRLNS